MKAASSYVGGTGVCPCGAGAVVGGDDLFCPPCGHIGIFCFAGDGGLPVEGAPVETLLLAAVILLYEELVGVAAASTVACTGTVVRGAAVTSATVISTLVFTDGCSCC
jgi:hypothetical protein